MKYIITIAVILMLMASTNKTNKLEDFHVKMVGEEKVEEFKNKFPFIVDDEAVYIAHLQQYYNGNEEEYMELLRWVGENN